MENYNTKFFQWITYTLMICRTPVTVEGLCRDMDSRCYPDLGTLGWYADWCDLNHSYVINGCPYMCALCSHEVYIDSALYFTFDEVHEETASGSVTKYFQSKHGAMKTDHVSKGIFVDPVGRSGGALTNNQSECLTIDPPQGHCLSDPGQCTSGLSYSLFFDMRAISATNVTLLTSGAHGPSRGIYFGYTSMKEAFQISLKTSKEVFSAWIPVDDFNLTRTVLAPFAFTWTPGSDLKVYIRGVLWRSIPGISRPPTPDSYPQLRLGCQEISGEWDGYMKLDELAVWVRELTATEIQLLSNPVADDNGSSGSVSSPVMLTNIAEPVTPAMTASETVQFLTDLNATISSGTINNSVKSVSNILNSLSTPQLLDNLSNDHTANLISTVSDLVDSLLRPDNYDAWEEFSETDPAALPLLVQAVDRVLEKITDHLLNGNASINIHHTRDNFEVTVKSGLEPVENLTFMSEGSVVLSTQVTPDVALVSNVFKGIGEIFPMGHNVTWEENHEEGIIEMSDHIVGVSLYPGNSSDQRRINLTFILNHPDNVTVTPKCVYLDYGSSKDDASWSDIGCQTEVIHPEVVCSCDHLTNFAILMQVIPVKLSLADEHALEVITFVGCTLSLLGAFLSVLTFLFLKIYTDRVLIHLNLAVAIIGAQILLLVEEAINRGTSACVAVTALLFYFNLAVFSWMLVEGVQLFLQIVVVFTSESRMKLFYTIGWGLPFILAGVIVPIFHKTLGQHGVCWLSPRDNSIWAFAVPALLVITVHILWWVMFRGAKTNLVILVAVMRVILNLSVAMDDKKIRSIKTAVKSSILLLPLLGCTWLFGVLTLSSDTVVFQYLFAATNSFQGLFIFICHCIYNSEVRDVFLRRKSTWDLSRHLKTHSKVEPLTNIRPSSFKARPAVQARPARDRVITPPTGSSVVGSSPDNETSKMGRRKSSLPLVCD